MSQKKSPYSIKLLQEQLTKETKGLAFWQKKTTSDDPLIVRMAKGNIGGCESRIEDLTIGLTALGAFETIQEQT